MKKSESVQQAGRIIGGLIFWAWWSNITSLFSESIYTVAPSGVHQHETVDLRNSTIQGKNVSWKDTARFDTTGKMISPPRFLLGIMSHELPQKGNKESDRRQMIRKTYLSYYKDHGSPQELHRICGLHEIVNGQIIADDCQIAYTFVIGQSIDLPVPSRTEFLNATNTVEMIRPHKSLDVLSLDIAENGKLGKSPTWFRYANLLLQENDLPFDYVIKTDSDTLLMPARFLRWMDQQEEKVHYQRTHIYGGMPLDKAACGWPSHDHCDYMSAPYFHGGGFYFVSLDVSKYIVSDQCPRSKLFLPHEDVTMGNYVHSMTETTGKPIIGFKNPDGYQDTWRHPVKDPKRILSLWTSYINKKKKRMEAKKNNVSVQDMAE